MALAGIAPLANAELVEITWDARQEFRQQLRVETGKFVELCGKLTPGTKVQWRFEAAVPLTFNVHYHEGKEVHYPAKEGNSSRSQGTLDVTSEQNYCWMWSNKSPVPVALLVHLSKGA